MHGYAKSHLKAVVIATTTEPRKWRFSFKGRMKENRIKNDDKLLSYIIIYGNKTKVIELTNDEVKQQDEKAKQNKKRRNIEQENKQQAHNVKDKANQV